MERMQSERLTLTVRDTWRMPEASENASREELGDEEGMETTPDELEVQRQRPDLREMREERKEDMKGNIRNMSR